MEPIYIVTDMRTVEDNGGYAVLITSTQHHSRQGAESQFYTKVAAAANPDSQYPRHAVTLMTNDGFVIESKGYVHEQEPEQTEEA